MADQDGMIKPDTLPSQTAPAATPTGVPASSTGGSFFQTLALKLIVLFVIVLLVLGGTVGYLYAVAPKRAVRGYLEMREEQNRSDFVLTLDGEASGSGQEGTFKLSASGDQDGSNPEELKLTTTFKGEAEFDGVSMNVEGELRMDGNTGYVRFTNAQIPLVGLYFGVDDEELINRIKDQWYSFDLEDLTAEADADKCNVESTEKLQEVLLPAMRDDLPVTELSRVGLFPEKVGDVRAAHYRGTLDLDKLKSQLEAYANSLSEECRGNLDLEELSESDASTIVTFDLWRGRDFDRLDVHVVMTQDGSEVNMTVSMTTSNYGKDVTVEAPDGAKPVEELMSDLFPADAPNPFLQPQPETEFDFNLEEQTVPEDFELPEGFEDFDI